MEILPPIGVKIPRTTLRFTQSKLIIHWTRMLSCSLRGIHVNNVQSGVALNTPHPLPLCLLSQQYEYTWQHCFERQVVMKLYWPVQNPQPCSHHWYFQSLSLSPPTIHTDVWIRWVSLARVITTLQNTSATAAIQTPHTSAAHTCPVYAVCRCNTPLLNCACV